MRRILRHGLTVVAVLAAFMFLNNTNLIATRPPGEPVLLAHRGLAQRYSATDMKADTCTATRILPPQHGFLENTIASMEASFAAGADLVEFDIHPTTDGRFAVFHDWTLECRTNGMGVTREHSMAELKTLDIGYGYTADGGKTFPFRGKGVGLMPTLDEVLDTFPNRQFVINVKSRDRNEGEKLAGFLSGLSLERRADLIVYGGDEPVAEVRARLPDIRIISRATLKACLLRYIGIGWTGIVPKTCEKTALLVPINVAPWLWGWPNRFLDRMDGVKTQVFVLGPYHGGEFSTGIDTEDDYARLPQGFSGGIWTNEIGLLGRKRQGRQTTQ